MVRLQAFITSIVSVATLVAIASPSGATEYIVPVDKPEEARIFYRSEIEPMLDGDLQIHFMQVLNPAQIEAGKLVHFGYWLVTFNCKAHTFRFGTIGWLDDDFRVASMSHAANYRLTDPVHPKAEDPFAQSIDAVCSGSGSTVWLHSDGDEHAVAMQKLTAMQIAK